MSHDLLRDPEKTMGIRKVEASVVEKWGRDRSLGFPNDFIEFFAERGGVYTHEQLGYQYIPEEENYLEFSDIGTFLHFDETMRDYLVDSEYENHFLTWNLPLMVPFAWSELNAYVAMDFRKSGSNPSVQHVDVFSSPRNDTSRPTMTWLAGSFTEFLDILETYESFYARNGEIYRF